MEKITFFIAIVCISTFAMISNAAAETCKYMDPQGNVTYSNLPMRNSKKLVCFETEEAKPTSRSNKASAPSAPPIAGNPGIPNVDPQTQKKRDDSRMKILNDELASEERKLADAKKTLAEAEAVRLGDEKNYQRYLDRIQPLKDGVTRSENNINAIKREISNTK